MEYRDLTTDCNSAEDFAARLVAEVPSDEWRQLENDELAGEINAFNRGVLLRLRQHDYDSALDTPFDADETGRMADMLQGFLDEHLPDNPRAQRWIVLSCLALAFVFHEPLHPVEVVKAEVREVGGKTVYYCPACEGDATLCGFCVCRPIA